MFCLFFSSNSFLVVMQVEVLDEIIENDGSYLIEVQPDDTVWDLKWMIYHESLKGYFWKMPISPDEQILFAGWRGIELSDCAKELEFYNIHEGSKIYYSRAVNTPREMDFKTIAGVFRKTYSFIRLGDVSHVLGVSNVVNYMHDVKSIRLFFDEWHTIQKNPRDYELIAKMLESMTTLKKLSLKRNYKLGDEHVIRLVKGLEMNPFVVNLNISHCKIAAEGAKAVGRVLRGCSLEKLNIGSNCGIGDDGIKEIMKGLEKNVSLKELRIQWCGIRSEGGKCIGKMLEKNTSLLKLDLTYNEDIGVEGHSRIAEGLEKNASLMELNLERCSVCVEGARKVGEMLKKNASLISLNLTRNPLGDEGMIHIADGLKRNSSLKKLVLEHCEIGAEGGKRIGEMLEENASLVKLILDKNSGIGNMGVIRVAKGLEINSSLKELHLNECDFESEGAEGIGQMLEKNISLLIINLKRNRRIGDEGCIRIAEGLERNFSLKKLNLAGCGIGRKGACRIGQMMQKNTSLTCLSLVCAWQTIKLSSHCFQTLFLSLTRTFIAVRC
eukprot:TRINITY_DN386_c0_g1_i6.p1 TRINITY_DN386_c0_g1~~TRINITY_DN386_c0_g1_i6.p1  ORF type:complete len:553 (-),score=124.59 TRINITY_DN386_c0_g1_i6:321-1979(-)